MTRFIERVLWAGSLAMLMLAGWRATRPARAVPSPGRASTTPPVAPAMFDADSLAEAAEHATDFNLFREDRARTPDLIADQKPAPVPRPTAPVPQLTLRGIVGGPPWDAIIDGIPGRTAGTVVRDGEIVAGFTITVTARDAVRINGADTSWTIFLRR